MMNEPYNGGTHLPDVTVITPVFDAAGRDIIYTVASRGHHAYMRHVQDNAEESVRRVLDVLLDCAFTYPLDSGAQIKVAISVDKQARAATIDFTGPSRQDPFNDNARSAMCHAVVLYVFRSLVGANIPMNEGCLKPLHLIISEGSMINRASPAAVISGNTEVSQAIADALYGALGVTAGNQGTMNNFVYGNDMFQNYETIRGGSSATGQFQGGNGIFRKLCFLEPMTVTVLTSHRITAPHGAAGGGGYCIPP